jgi:MFS family permease
MEGKATHEVPDPRRWRALALLCGAFFMVILDATIVIIALPSIGADLHCAEQTLQWVLSADALTYGGLLLLAGRAAGIGLAFVTATVAALAGVAERETGLASGLSKTALQIGGALGVAILTSVAISRSRNYLTAHASAHPLLVLTHGYQAAFIACVVLAGIGLVLALVLLRRPRAAHQERLEPAPAASAAN